MSTTNDPFDYDHDLATPPEQRQITLVADRVEHDTRPDEIVLSPLETEPGVFTTWITADADDMLTLENCR